MSKSLVLNRSRKVPAEDTAAFGAIAERFRRAGALERAVDLCREGLQKFPDHISARVTLGWSLLDVGKYDEAQVELEQVLRRAPDNLAAIRGLAELHDRFEHTLNLPMDGPGQWPPPPELTDAPDPQVEAATGEDTATGEMEMTPAALGIPIWSSVVSPTAVSEPPPPIDAPAAAAVPAQTAAPAPVPEATHVTPAECAVSEPATVESAASGSGMSSVREIDFGETFAVAVPALTIEEPLVAAVEPRAAPAESIELAADVYAVSDADIQALLAEADSLDAAAIPAQDESEALSLEALALGGGEPMLALTDIAPRALAYTSVTEPISVDLDLDAAPTCMADPIGVPERAGDAGAAYAPVTVCAPEPVVAPAPAFAIEPPVLESPEEVFEAALEIAAPLIDAALVIAAPTLASARVSEESASGSALVSEEPVPGSALVSEEPVPGSALVSEEPVPGSALVSEEPVPGSALVSEEPVPGSALVSEEPMLESAREAEAVFEAALEISAPIVEAALEIEEPDALAAAEVPRSPVPALERFLTQVNARRAQLMAESVA